MHRLLDSPIEEIRQKLSFLHRRVDDLLSCALISIKDPLCGLGLDAENQDEEVNRLEKELQQLISSTLALHHSYARDHRFLLAAMATITDLEHMGDAAKRLCKTASAIGVPLESLLLFLQLTQKRCVACFRILHQIDLLETKFLEETAIATNRREIEEAYSRALSDLEEWGMARLNVREWQHQILMAFELKRICDCVASIIDQLLFYRTGVYPYPS